MKTNGNRKKSNRQRRAKGKPSAKHAELPDTAVEQPAPEVDDGFVDYCSSPEREDSPAPQEETKPSIDKKRRRSANTTAKPEQRLQGTENPPSSSDGDSDDDEDISDEEAAEITLQSAPSEESDVEVTLDFYDPRPEDDEVPIAAFLNAWTARFGGDRQKNPGADGSAKNREHVSAAKLSEVVCAQKRVGTTVRVGEDDEAPVAFISCLNVRKHAALLNPAVKFLRKKCAAGDVFAKLLENCSEGIGRFEKEKMGLLLCERVVNLPPMVLPKLMEAIFCEIEWAREDEPSEESREEYRFGWYLYLTEVFIGGKAADENAVDGEDASKAKKPTMKRQKKARNAEGNADHYSFARAEDEAMYKHANHVKTWDFGSAETAGGGVVRKGIALLMNAKNVKKMRESLEEMVGFAEPTDMEGVEQEGDGNKE